MNIKGMENRMEAWSTKDNYFIVTSGFFFLLIGPKQLLIGMFPSSRILFELSY